MGSEQSGCEGKGQRIREEVALDQSEAHDNEEKCKVQAYKSITILRMTGKKSFHNTYQKPKLEYRDQSR